MKRISIVLFLLVFFASFNGVADELGFPRWASLKDDKVFVRAGPGKRYPILWVFNRRGWPVTLIAEYENWYKIRDLEGEEGWIYRGIIRNEKTGVVREGEVLAVYRTAELKQVFAKLEPGVVVDVNECSDVLCEIELAGREGWVTKKRLMPQFEQ